MTEIQININEGVVDVEKSVFNTSFCSILGFDCVINYMSFTYNYKLPKPMETFMDKHVQVGNTKKPRFKVAFITDLNMAITQGSSEVKKVLTGTESLLHSIFCVTEADTDNITKLLTSKTRNDGNLYFLVAFFGHTVNRKGIDKIEVISAALGSYSKNVGGYVGYFAASQTKYSVNKYGKSADGEQFERRGIGQIVISLFQFVIFWKSNKKAKNIYLHCDEKREVTFLKYGFTKCTKTMPTKAIELHHLLGISSSCIKELQLTAMMIEKEVFW